MLTSIISALEAFLGVSFATLMIISICIGALNLFWAVFSAILANNRGRSGLSWFFLAGIYGVLAFLLLLIAGPLQKETKDTMGRVLWAILLIPAILSAILVFIAAY